MGNKILVTGGAGFIGGHLCEALLKEGSEVVCMDNFNDYYNPKYKQENIKDCLQNKKFTLLTKDFRDKDIAKVFDKYDIRRVIHLGAQAGVRYSIENPLLYLDVNVSGTLNLLEASRKNNVKHFIFGSSSSVYGLNKKVPFSEEDKVDKPISPYAASKAAGELYCHAFSHLYGINTTCLRFFTVYGPRGRPDMAPYKFTKLISEGRPIEMYGDGSSKRDYTYITDIVDGIVEASKKEFKYEIINLGDSRAVELNYLISLVEREVGRKAIIERKPVQLGDVPLTFADISKAGRLLNYQPKVGIEEGVKRLVSWYKKTRQ
ncbi:MAG: NAD-dependent epimerase/dehydratase family protein [Candidatus Altiarchaeales archaeon]|nr:NAD-dependent epimerase/dehydratase family protein [Candidatus Altiarchaeales archaeon]